MLPAMRQRSGRSARSIAKTPDLLVASNTHHNSHSHCPGAGVAPLKLPKFTAGGFSAPGGVATKRRLLAIEGAEADEPTLFDQCGGLEFAVRRKAGMKRRGG